LPLRYTPTVDVTRLGLTSEELKLVDLLRAEPADIMTLCAQSELTPDATRRVLYLLVVTRAVAPYQSSASRTTSPGFAASRTSSPGFASPATVTARPGPGDPAPGVTSVPPRHPSMTPRPSAMPISSGTPRPSAMPTASVPPGDRSPTGKVDLSSVAPPGSRSLSPSAAWQALAARAAASLRPGALSQPPTTPSMVPGAGPRRSLTPRPSLPPLEALDSDSKFRRAEQLIQRQAYEEALPLVRALVAEEPKVAKHHGILAQVLLGRSTERTTVSKDIVDAVNQALRIDEDQTHALYTKGLCYKRLGKEREALHYFKRAVAADPNHIEAAREARLLRLRSSEDLEDKKSK
jgi:hypothetical protein